MERILVIQGAKLGDMVCTTPVFRAIKKNFPTCRLYVMGDSTNREILRGSPHIDEYIELKSSSTSFLKKSRIDAAIMLNPSPKILGQLLLARVKKIITPKIVGGFSPYNTKSYRALSLLTTRVERRFGQYAPQEYLNMLKPLGINSQDTKKELYFDRVSEMKVEELFKNHAHDLKFVISPSAGNKIKNWGGKKFAELADEIYRKWKSDIFIIGSDRDREEVTEMIAELSPDTKVVNLLSRLSIEELKAFISKSDMFISVDTGPIYIAEAFDVPTVDIIGPIDESEQPPRGKMHKWVISPSRNKPLLYVLNARDYDVDAAKRSTDSISVEMVLEAVVNLHSMIINKK